MDSEIIVALITGAVTILGVVIVSGKQFAIITNEIKHLSDEVEKHNKVIERVYALERRADVYEEKIDVANHRLSDLEKGGN